MFKASNRGFSLMELMISALLFSVVTAVALTIYSRLKRTELEASVQSELRMASKQVEKMIQLDLQNAVLLGGNTVAGTHFDATSVYGVHRFPNSAVDGATWDGLTLYVFESTNSLSDSFPVQTASASGSGTNLSIKGDFRPIYEVDEDLFVIRKSNRTELFRVNGMISVSGAGGAQVSSFNVEQAFPNEWLPIDAGEAPEVFRVERRTYRIGDGGEQTTGLYRVRQGVSEQISSKVDSMQVQYWLMAKEAAAEADCQSKSGDRYLPAPADDTDCSWNDLSSLRVELVLTSTQEISSTTAHPHTGVEDERLKYVSIVSGVPADYFSELTN